MTYKNLYKIQPDTRRGEDGFPDPSRRPASRVPQGDRGTLRDKMPVTCHILINHSTSESARTWAGKGKAPIEQSHRERPLIFSMATNC